MINNPALSGPAPRNRRSLCLLMIGGVLRRPVDTSHDIELDFDEPVIGADGKVMEVEWPEDREPVVIDRTVLNVQTLSFVAEVSGGTVWASQDNPWDHDLDVVVPHALGAAAVAEAERIVVGSGHVCLLAWVRQEWSAGYDGNGDELVGVSLVSWVYPPEIAS